MRDNRLFINDVDSYNRDIAMINRSLSDRLGLGHTSVPGAQQVIPIGKFNDQRTYIQNYLRESRLGENARNIYSDEQNRREYTIPQFDGIADSNTSMTTDSIDLTVSPLKRKTTVTDKHTINLDASNDDIDEIYTEN